MPALNKNRLFWLASIAAIFTLLQVNQSLLAGHLALPVTYDDSNYFVDTLRRIDILYHSGLKSFIYDLASNPPHSVTSTLMVFTGFSVFGVQDFTPALANRD